MSPAALLGPLLLFAPALTACGSMTAPSAESVTEIRQERDCSGCEIGVTVTLRRDGSATLAHAGKARFGTRDRAFTGRVADEDFDRLAALLVSRGFFDLQDEYRDPRMADGAWVTTTAIGDGRTKTVVDSNAAGPAALRDVEEAVEAVRAAIAWTAVSP